MPVVHAAGAQPGAGCHASAGGVAPRARAVERPRCGRRRRGRPLRLMRRNQHPGGRQARHSPHIPPPHPPPRHATYLPAREGRCAGGSPRFRYRGPSRCRASTTSCCWSTRPLRRSGGTPPCRGRVADQLGWRAGRQLRLGHAPDGVRDRPPARGGLPALPVPGRQRPARPPQPAAPHPRRRAALPDHQDQAGPADSAAARPAGLRRREEREAQDTKVAARAAADAPAADAPPTDAPPTDAPPTDAPATDAPPTDEDELAAAVPPAEDE